MPIRTSDINVIKKTAVELLSEFPDRKKFKIVGEGVSKLRERDERQSQIVDFT